MKKVIIIGAGIGGLTLAGFLAGQGVPVTLFEKSPVPGGYLSDYGVKEYRVSHTIDWLSGLQKGGSLSNLLEKLGIKKDISYSTADKFKRVIGPGIDVPFSCDPNEFETTLMGFFPNEKPGISSFTSIVKEFFSPNGINKFRPYLDDSYLEFLKRLFKNPILISVLSANIDVYSPAYHVIPYYFKYINSKACYLDKKNLTQFTRIIENKLFEMGVEIYKSCGIKKIVTKNNKIKGVLLYDDDFEEGDIVITSMDISKVYNEMLDGVDKNNPLIKKLNKRKISGSLASVFLGLNRKLKDVKTKGEPLVYLPTYNLDDLSSKDPAKYHIKLNIRSILQPFLAPPESSIVEISALVGKDLFAPWQNNPAYSTQKDYKNLKKIIGNRLCCTACKILNIKEEQIEVKRIATPLTFQRFTGNRGGSFMGWEQRRGEYGKDFKIESPIDGLFHTGQWATRSGLEGVINHCFTLFPELLKRIIQK